MGLETAVSTKDGRPCGTPAYDEFEHRMSLERYTYMLKDIPDFFQSRVVYCPGCGWGAAEKHIANIGAKKVYGADINGSAIQIAKDKYGVEGVTEYVEEDILKYFPNDAVSIICAVEIVEHVTDVELDMILKTWHEKLTNDGVLYITTPERRLAKNEYPHGSHFTEFDFDELVEIVSKYGFKLVWYKRKDQTDGISMAMMFTKV